MITCSMCLYVFVKIMVCLIYGWNDSYVDEKYDYGHVYEWLEFVTKWLQ